MITAALLFSATTLFTPADWQRSYGYVPGPVDNPYKGLVPYAGEWKDRFPHSLEFDYLPLNKVMTGPNTFNWQPFENLLNAIAGRGHQAVCRFYVEYPGQPSGLPSYLLDEGVKLHRYSNPGEKDQQNTPDYKDPRVQRALTQFITALAQKYDGDPRLGYLTAGLLGYWGEWHTYPRSDLHPGPSVQKAILEAYQKAFKKTPVLLRYPAKDGDANYASNRDLPFGYHDDSFAWATLDTGKADDFWFFEPLLKASGTTQKWMRHPIGGEIRPEAWGKVFDDRPGMPQIQDFRKCVDATHATWLMDTGLFREKPSAERLKNATREVARMGYDLCVTKASFSGGTLSVTIENKGVAPLYHPLCVKLLSGSQSWATGWDLRGILPGASREFKVKDLPIDRSSWSLLVPNPLKNGLPLRFANDRARIGKDGSLSL